MKTSFHRTLPSKTRFLLTVSGIVLLACWGISLLQQGPDSAFEPSHSAATDLAIAAPVIPSTASGVVQPDEIDQYTLAQQAATVLLGLIAAGDLTVLASHAFHERMHGCGCVALLAAVGIVALLAALFWWV